jgi:hypothetical protein
MVLTDLGIEAMQWEAHGALEYSAADELTDEQADALGRQLQPLDHLHQVDLRAFTAAHAAEQRQAATERGITVSHRYGEALRMNRDGVANGAALSAEQAARLAPMFKALGDPARLRLLSLIAASGSEACVCDRR